MLRKRVATETIDNDSIKDFEAHDKYANKILVRVDNDPYRKQ